jgi:hypothetical protein
MTAYLRLAALLLPAAMLLAPAPGRAEVAVPEPPPTEKELAELAKSVQKLLRGRGEDAVSVGPFRCKRDPDVSHGPGLCRKLALELDRVGVKVRGDAGVSLEGEYEDKIDKRTKRVYIELTCRAVDRKGGTGVLVTLKRGIFGESALVEFLAPNAAALNPAGTSEEREASLLEQIDSEKPLARLDGTKVYAPAGRPYAVEFLVKNGNAFEAVRPKFKGAEVYVPLKRGDVFRVRLYNDAAHEGVAEMSIDGLNVFVFSEFAKAGGMMPRWLVSKKGRTEVKGWPVRSGLSHEFTLTEYAKSAVAELNRDASKVGVLTVSFAAAWKQAENPPDDEKGRDASNAVGKGAPIDTPFETRPMVFGRTRAVISVRYPRE